MRADGLDAHAAEFRGGSSPGMLRFAGFHYWTAVVMPALVGTVLPFWLRPPGFAFRWLGAIEFLVASVLMYAGLSFLQARFDGKATADWSARRLLSAGVVCALLAGAIGLHLATITTRTIFLVYGLATIFAGLLYVVPPMSLREHPGGEIVLAQSLGMLPVLGAYLVQTGDLTRTVYLASLPIVVSTGLWAWVTKMASRRRDVERGRGSLVVSFGSRFSGRVGVPALSAALCATLTVAVVSSSVAPLSLIGLISLVFVSRVLGLSWVGHADEASMNRARGAAAAVHFTVCAAIVAGSLMFV